MTENEKLEFSALISKNSTEIVAGLMKPESGLGPLDSGFCLGAALKLISGVMAKMHGVAIESAQDELLAAFNSGYKNTKAQVVIIGGPESKH